MAEPQPEDVTRLLAQIAAGDNAATDRLFTVLYEELHQEAEKKMRRERADHTLQPTALVHEAYLRLVTGEALRNLQSRAHFLNTAAQAMHRVLVDHARARQAAKRGGGQPTTPVDDLSDASGEPVAESDPAAVLAFDDALEALGRANPQHRRVLLLSHYAGLPVTEIAATLGVPARTVESDLRMAKAWLKARMR